MANQWQGMRLIGRADTDAVFNRTGVATRFSMGETSRTTYCPLVLLVAIGRP